MGKPAVLTDAKMESFSMGREMREAIEEWRKRQSPMPTKSEAIRQLIQAGLDRQSL
jgi:Arc/MetJ-type ribon-helix-helix transcriptional regulator